ncbi:Zinc finger CCCH domain-containing protein [Quillaja saponaria]|uniref:Zinc finger CCCH domain-containing protein n=1 Tax=Quillaja saponaria TaxID=32244 RepID=A0AAD7VNS8_QUISA|nr:Zinc finger CCCH domain-containing protein [Quillaja saponaria]
MHNSKGLPLRPGEVDCPFYVKNGSCKYGACCCYHHPDRNEINLSADAIGHTVVASTAANLNIDFVNPVASIYQALDPRFLVKDASSITQLNDQHHHCQTKLHNKVLNSLLQDDLGERVLLSVPYYLKTGTCKYVATCKFDHPPPGEAMAMASTQGTSSGGDGQGNEKGADSVLEQQRSFY